MNMKYRLFDLAVVLSTAASILSQYCTLGLLIGNHTKGVNAASETDYPSPSYYCDERTANAKPTFFGVGDIVEVFEPTIHPSYAFLAQIARVSPDRSKGNQYAVQYDVRLGFGGAIYENIDSSAVSTMEPFEQKTHAMCDDGKALNSKLIPCTVDFHVPTSKRFFGEGNRQQEHPWLYSISYQEDGEWRQKKIPVSRIRRIVDHQYSRERQQRTADEEPSCGNNEPATRSPSRSAQEAKPKTFSPGSVVEIYGPGAAFAFPATVTSINHEDDDTNQNQHERLKYNLTHGITQSKLKDLDPKFVHPYHIYKVGTPASCNVGKLRKIILVPCTVMSHVADGEDDIIYQVSTKSMDPSVTENPVLLLPRFRVQRRMKGPVGRDRQ